MTNNSIQEPGFYLRPWGSYTVLISKNDFWLKTITIKPKHSLSLQYHNRRRELWVPVEEGLVGVINGKTFHMVAGDHYVVDPKVLHRISNPGGEPKTIIEVATGTDLSEDDIFRTQDKYGRADW